MIDRSSDTKPFSLRRWSQRKAAARAEPRANAERRDGAKAAVPSALGSAAAATPIEARTIDTFGSSGPLDSPAGPAAPSLQPASPLPSVSSLPSASPLSSASPLPSVSPPSSASPMSSVSPMSSASASPRSPASPLPALDSLSIESDFTAFMQPGVDESLKRGALKRLFSDPRFNVMDGLDVYIDDYSKPDPLDPAIVRTLAQARYIFNPPATRVTAEGHVEDVPEDELPATARDAGAEASAEPQDAGRGTAAAPPGEQPPSDAALSISEKDEAVRFVVQQQQHDAVPQQHDALEQQHDAVPQQHDALEQQHDALQQQHDVLSQRDDAVPQQDDVVSASNAKPEAA